MNSVRVVLDTNTLVSALLFGRGRLACLRSGWQTGQFIPLVCRETAAELVRVLAYPKFRLEPDEINALLADFLPWAETCSVKETGQPIEGLDDPDDAVFVHLTGQAGADYLVSGDAHILALRESSPPVEILSPAEFIDRLELEDRSAAASHGPSAT